MILVEMVDDVTEQKMPGKSKCPGTTDKIPIV